MSTLPAYLQPLEFTTRPYPRAAAEAALENWDESLPYLLEALAAVVQDPEAVDPDYQLHFHALYLLAQRRETRAYPWIVRLFRLPEHEALTGDMDTEVLPRLLASTCNGDILPIQELIEDPAVDEWVRGSAVAALGVLAVAGAQPRAEISAYFGELFATRLEREPMMVWDNLVSVCLDLRMQEHLPAIRALFDDDIADPSFIGVLPAVEEEMAQPPPELGQRYQLMDQAIDEMEAWAFFDPEEAAEEAALLEVMQQAEEKVLEDLFPTVTDSPYLHSSNVPQVRETPKIGRNELCPCGSGKKYKKCCGKAGGA